jgi:nucleoside-diphosphate-sugar epimerase
VLVTGAAGMLGSQLLADAPAGVGVVGTDLAERPGLDAPGVDLADPAAVAALFERLGSGRCPARRAPRPDRDRSG